LGVYPFQFLFMKFPFLSFFIAFLVLGLLGAVVFAASETTGNISTGLETNVSGVVKTPPSFAPLSGVYTGAQSVILSATGSTGMCYTTDGITTPVCATGTTCTTGTLYTGAIPVSTTMTIKAISCYTATEFSGVASSSYTLSYASSGGGGGGGGGGGSLVIPTPTEIPTPTPTPTGKTLKERVVQASIPRTTVKGAVDWAQNCAQDLRQAGVINADANGDFNGGDNIKRAEAVKMITLAAGEKLLSPFSSSFVDVLKENWFFQYVETGVFLKWITGYEGGLFKPQNPITRSEPRF